MSGNSEIEVSGGTHTKRVSPQLKESERKRIVYDLERERYDVWSNIIEACEIEGKRQFLATLYINDGVCRYKELFEAVNRSERTIKKHAKHLEQQGIINKSGNPAFVSFVDTDIALLATDALNMTDKL